MFKMYEEKSRLKPDERIMYSEYYYNSADAELSELHGP